MELIGCFPGAIGLEAGSSQFRWALSSIVSTASMHVCVQSMFVNKTI